MKLFYALLFLTLFTSTYCQEWIWQRPKPFGSTVEAAAYAGNSFWIVTGHRLLKSSDNGATWNKKFFFDSTAYMLNVFFIDDLHGWVVGYDGTFSRIARTTDGGNTWIESLPSIVMQSRFIIFVDTLRGWVLGNAIWFLQTTDGGISWTKKYTSIYYSQEGLVFTDTLNGWVLAYRNTEYGGSEPNLLHTTDGGVSWTAQVMGELYYGISSSKFFSHDKGYLFSNNGILLKTTNNGEFWDISQSPGEKGYILDENNLWCTSLTTIYHSSDAGNNWQIKYQNSKMTLFGIFFQDSLRGLAFGAYGCVVVTTDGGTNWSSTSSLDVNYQSDLKSIHFSDSLNGWVVGNIGEAFRTTDAGNNWTKVTIPGAKSLRSVFFLDNDRGWIAGDSAIYRTTDKGETWSMFSSFSSKFFPSAVQFFPDGTGYTSGYSAQIKYYMFVSSDFGVTWEKKVEFSSIEPYMYFRNKNLGFIPTRNGLLKTTDGGYTWIYKYPSEVKSLAFEDDNNIWGVLKNAGIIHSADGGETWSLIPTGYLYLPDIQYSNGALYISSGDHILQSFDDGVTLKFIESNTSNYFRTLYFREGTGWAAGTGGQILTYNNPYFIPVEMTSFTLIQDGRNVILNWSTSTESNNKGFTVERKSEAGQWEELTFISGKGTTTEMQNYSYTDVPLITGKYYYRIKQIDFDGTSEYSNILETETTPIEFALYQNFPNPFNPVTEINYTLPKESIVKISVYNSIGQLVTVLVDEKKDAGHYEILFDGSKLSSGVYFYTLHAGEYNSVKKMSLIK